MAETNSSKSPDITADEICFVETASGAVGASLPVNPGTPHGTVILSGGSALAMTLPLPVAGVDDGKTLTFIDIGGHAHTITTPASGINGADHIATFGGTAYTVWQARAYNGGWVCAYSTTGINLS